MPKFFVKSTSRTISQPPNFKILISKIKWFSPIFDWKLEHLELQFTMLISATVTDKLSVKTISQPNLLAECGSRKLWVLSVSNRIAIVLFMTFPTLIHPAI